VGSFQSRASSERRLDPSAPLRRRILLGTTAVAALMAAGFAVVHFMRDRPELGYFSLHFTRGHRPAVLVATLYAAGVTLFLLAWGRAPAGDFVWTLLVPPMIAYAGGRRLACWLLPSYLLSAAVIVLWPGFSRHALWNELELTLRYLGLLVLLSAVSYLYELTRNRAQQELEAQVREREAAERRLEQANARLIEAAEQAANLAAQAQAANLAKTRFLSHMSHDIRTPLTGIVGMASVLELTELDPSLPQRLVVDRTRLERVLLNLAGNAIKFTNRGRVDLRLRGHPDDPRWWRVEVQDTGIGIAPGQHRRIFDSFTQVDLSSTRRQGGTGLGLAIVSRLVALMGGELGLDSDEGVGSTFWVDLPIVEPGELDEAPPTEDELPSLDPRRLLVVDDNEIVRQVLCALLRHDGHGVEEASDGAQALERLALREFDAVLMDVQMPRLDGMEATRRLRRGEGGVLDPSVPVVGVTALADTDTRQACEHAGMDAVLTKPVHPRTLVATLARVLQDPRG
jgi:signal transduction histidine kinase/ActR/RegA family two-component response regulator